MLFSITLNMLVNILRVAVSWHKVAVGVKVGRKQRVTVPHKDS